MKRRNELIFFGDFFEWQYTKAEANVVKHQITFEEASKVFFFSETQDYVDELHSFEERRYFAVGYTTKGNLLVVCYTERSRFHIISAWKANSSERKDYEEKRNQFKEYGF